MGANRGWLTPAGLVNLTPHELSIHDPDGKLRLVLPPEGAVARVTISRTVIGYRIGIPFYATSAKEIEGLPEPKLGTIYVVSLAVRQALSGRLDLASPGEPIRDAEGKVVGCKGLDKNN